MKYILKNDSIKLKIPKKIYNKNVLFGCFYWYLDQFSIEIRKNKRNFSIVMKPKFQKMSEINIQNFIDKINDDLIDFKLRDIINIETKRIREIIIAKAFANSDEFKLPPIGHIKNPFTGS